MEGNGNCVQAEAVAYVDGMRGKEGSLALALDWVAQHRCARHKDAVRRIIRNPRRSETGLCPVLAVVAHPSA